MANKWIVYVATGFTYNIFTIFGIQYSILKSQFSKDLHFHEEFMGLTQAVSFFFRFVGTLLMILLRVKKQKLLYSVAGVIQILGYFIMVLAHFSPQNAKLCFILGSAVSGICRGVFYIPFVIVSQFFDSERQQKYISWWLSSLAFGSVFAYFFSYFLISKVSWESALMIMCGLFLLSVLVHHIAVPEIESQGNAMEDMSVGKTWQVIKDYIRVPSQFLIILESGFVISPFMCLEIWGVYYLVSLHIPNYLYITAFSSFMLLPGSLVLENLIIPFPNFKRVLTTSFLFLMFLCAIYFAMMPVNNYIGYYFVFYLVYFFSGGTCSRTQGEVVTSASENIFKKTIIVNLSLIMRELTIGTWFYLIGHFMEQSFDTYPKILIFVAGIPMIIHLIRRILETLDEVVDSADSSCSE